MFERDSRVKKRSSFSVRSARRLLTTDFLQVDELVVAGTDGREHLRTVVRHPGAIVVVPVDPSGNYALCVRQYRAATGGELLEVVAGKRDGGESIEQTARRELHEETGLDVNRLVKIAEFWNSPGFSDEYSHLFVAIGVDFTTNAETEVNFESSREPEGPEEAAMELVVVRLDSVEEMISSREIVDAKTILALLLARQYLADAHSGVEESQREVETDASG